MHEFPGPHDRIRRILDQALTECTYVASRNEGEGAFLLQARRTDGRAVGVRFRGVKNSDTDTNAHPEPGVPLKLKSVKQAGGSLVSRLFPLIKPPGPAYARVRIEAGPATLEIVCQDAEWWEE